MAGPSNRDRFLDALTRKNADITARAAITTKDGAWKAAVKDAGLDSRAEAVLRREFGAMTGPEIGRLIRGASQAQESRKTKRQANQKQPNTYAKGVAPKPVKKEVPAKRPGHREGSVSKPGADGFDLLYDALREGTHLVPGEVIRRGLDGLKDNSQSLQRLKQLQEQRHKMWHEARRGLAEAQDRLVHLEANKGAAEARKRAEDDLLRYQEVIDSTGDAPPKKLKDTQIRGVLKYLEMRQDETILSLAQRSQRDLRAKDARRKSRAQARKQALEAAEARKAEAAAKKAAAAEAKRLKREAQVKENEGRNPYAEAPPGPVRATPRSRIKKLVSPREESLVSKYARRQAFWGGFKDFFQDSVRRKSTGLTRFAAAKKFNPGITLLGRIIIATPAYVPALVVALFWFSIIGFGLTIMADDGLAAGLVSYAGTGLGAALLVLYNGLALLVNGIVSGFVVLLRVLISFVVTMAGLLYAALILPLAVAINNIIAVLPGVGGEVGIAQFNGKEISSEVAFRLSYLTTAPNAACPTDSWYQTIPWEGSATCPKLVETGDLVGDSPVSWTDSTIGVTALPTGVTAWWNELKEAVWRF